jgi:hypothetical protein
MSLSRALQREMHALTAEIGGPVLFVMKGLQAYRGDWGSGGSTIGPDDELRIKDAIDAIAEHHTDLSLCLNAFGGSSASAFNVSRLLRSRFTSLVVYVPHVAASAATLLSLSANRIVMSRCAYMTMVDPLLRVGTVLVQATQILDAPTLDTAVVSPEQRLTAMSSMTMIEGHLDTVLGDAGYDETAQLSIKRRLLFSRGSHDAPISRRALRDAGVNIPSDRECDGSDALRRAERFLRLLVDSGMNGLVASDSPRERRRAAS